MAYKDPRPRYAGMSPTQSASATRDRKVSKPAPAKASKSPVKTASLPKKEGILEGARNLRADTSKTGLPVKLKMPKASSTKKSEPTKPEPTKASASSDPYAAAKKKNLNLDKLVSARNQAVKGSSEYAEIQNKINEAYGVKKRHKIRPKPISVQELASKAKLKKVGS